MRALSSVSATRLRKGQVVWIEAGQSVLRERGVAEINVANLASEAGKTSGSFYHHFSDVDKYLGELALYYSKVQLPTIITRIENETAEPLERIAKLGSESARQKIWKLTAAMTIWATADDRARDAVAEGEHIVLGFLVRAFRDLGFREKEAQVRAKMLLILNISRSNIGTLLHDADFRLDAFMFLLRSDLRAVRPAKSP